MTEERFKPIPKAAITPEQVTMVEAITAGPRAGSLRGPFKALMRSPDLGNRLQHVGAYIRFGSIIPTVLNELAILLAGRKLNAQYEFYAHRQLGLAAGLRPELADAIARGRRPAEDEPQRPGRKRKFGTAQFACPLPTAAGNRQTSSAGRQRHPSLTAGPPLHALAQLGDFGGQLWNKIGPLRRGNGI